MIAATAVALTALTSCGGAEEKVEDHANGTEGTIDAASLYDQTIKLEGEVDELNLELENLNEVEIELDELDSKLDSI